MSYSEYQYRKDIVNALDLIAKRLETLDHTLKKFVPKTLETPTPSKGALSHNFVLCNKCKAIVERCELEVLYSDRIIDPGVLKKQYLCPKCHAVVEERDEIAYD